MKQMLNALRRRQLNRLRPSRTRILDGAIHRFMKRRVGGSLPLFALTDAEYGWGNEAWAADEHYLSRLISEAEAAGGVIVECGSGLSTILLASIAAKAGVQLHSLEHNVEWKGRVESALASFGLNQNTVHHAPLRSYGDFDWYTVPDSLPGDATLVVCDGPPSDTRGGRYGALPCLRSRLAGECTVLLDDANRASERGILTRWESEFGVQVQLEDVGRGYGRVTVPAA